MLHTVKTGEPAFPQQFGMPLFEYLASNGDTKLFRAMSSISAARTAGLLQSYDFAGASQLVDMGAAHGTMTAAIASRHPEIHCICFDLPGAEQGVNRTFADIGVAERCRFVGGDFFKDVPADADTYLLSAVLHDWDDDHCIQILRNCRRRIQDMGTLLVVDLVLSDAKNVRDTYRNCLELGTMTQIGGMERTESEFRTLLTRAGFKLSEVINMRAPQSVLVAQPA